MNLQHHRYDERLFARRLRGPVRAVVRAGSPLADPLVRWAGVPWAAGAGWLAGMILPIIPGGIFRAIFSEDALQALIGIEYRTAVIGALAAIGMVVCGAWMAPGHRRAAALVLFAVGAWAA